MKVLKTTFSEFRGLTNTPSSYDYEVNDDGGSYILNTNQILKIPKGHYVFLDCNKVCEILNHSTPNKKIQTLYYFFIQENIYLKALEDNTIINIQKFN
jgi:hypothetical protein